LKAMMIKHLPVSNHS